MRQYQTANRKSNLEPRNFPGLNANSNILFRAYTCDTYGKAYEQHFDNSDKTRQQALRQSDPGLEKTMPGKRRMKSCLKQRSNYSKSDLG